MTILDRGFCECLLRPADLRPSSPEMEVIGAFNPGAAQVGDEVIVMARVAEAVAERREGWFGLPRWHPAENRLLIDWLAEDEVELLDPRVVRLRRDGTLRLTFLSHLRLYRSRDGHALDLASEQFFWPQGRYEEYGVEDPRVTPIGDTFYITYVSVSRHGAGTSLASTRDFRSFERHGVIFCPENKDVVLFPEKIGGAYMAVNRPNPAYKFSPPEMWLARSPDLDHWGAQQVMRLHGATWGMERVGAGPPPIALDDGWLLMYHGSDLPPGMTGVVGVYKAGLLLLDRVDPSLILAASPGPIMAPEADFELQGFVPNVVFPTAIVARDGALQVYYGAADNALGVAEYSLDQIRSSLKPLLGC